MQKISTAAVLAREIFSPEGILKADRLDSLRQSERVESLARSKAAQYLRRARERGRQIRKEARQAGYAEGISQFSAAIERLDTARSQLHTRLDGLLRQGLYGLLSRMPKEEWLLAVLDNVMGELRGDAEIVIMAHPVNMRALATVIEAVKQQGNSLSIRPEPNPQMAEDECLVYAGLEVIDVSVPVMVEEMLAALKGVPVNDGSDDEESANVAEAAGR